MFFGSVSKRQRQIWAYVVEATVADCSTVHAAGAAPKNARCPDFGRVHATAWLFIAETAAAGP